MFKKKKFLVIISFVVLVVLVLLFVMFGEGPSEDINTFEECVDAGYPTVETYPEQCFASDGRIFVQEVDEDNIVPELYEFYGSSTYYACEVNEECMVSGCNNEICQSTQEEEVMSICIFPEQPLPKDLGYSCGCFDGKCQWGN